MRYNFFFFFRCGRSSLISGEEGSWSVDPPSTRPLVRKWYTHLWCTLGCRFLDEIDEETVLYIEQKISSDRRGFSSHPNYWKLRLRNESDRLDGVDWSEEISWYVSWVFGETPGSPCLHDPFRVLGSWTWHIRIKTRVLYRQV